MAHIVTCVYCKQKFDRDKVPTHAVGTRRYAHEECYQKVQSEMTKEEKDKQALEDYIKKIFNTNTITAKIQRQINSYVKEYNYSYSGILKALVYFYDLKHNSIEKANGGIGIVPYIYQDAYNYYYNLWLIGQKNEKKLINTDLIPIQTEIRIPVPKKEIKKPKRFLFLDEFIDEEVPDEQ